MASLRQVLATQPVTEQAKGMLMLLRNWSADDAFAALVEVSQATNIKLHDVAAVVVVAAGSNTESGLDGATAASVLTVVKAHVLGSAFG